MPGSTPFPRGPRSAASARADRGPTWDSGGGELRRAHNSGASNFTEFPIVIHPPQQPFGAHRQDASSPSVGAQIFYARWICPAIHRLIGDLEQSGRPCAAEMAGRWWVSLLEMPRRASSRIALLCADIFCWQMLAPNRSRPRPNRRPGSMRSDGDTMKKHELAWTIDAQLAEGAHLAGHLTDSELRAFNRRLIETSRPGPTGKRPSRGLTISQAATFRRRGH